MPRRPSRTQTADRSRRAAPGKARDNGAEQALRATEARLKAVLDTAVDAIITINERGLIQSVNPATEQMFGYTTEELLQQNVRMLMPSPHREQHDAYLARYLRTGEKHIIGIGREVEGRRKDGTVFPVDLAVSEVERGALFTGIIRDISERKVAEARARETDRLASIGTLAAGLGHDMNNVLLPVRAHLNALRSIRSTDEFAPHVDRIERGVKYLQQLADGLHFLAMNPDEEENQEGTTNLNQWWAQTGALLSKALPKHVDVRVTLPPDLPHIGIAAHALTQVVLNLLVNAGEAIKLDTKGTRGSVHIRAHATSDDACVELGITDNGMGMSDEVQRRAFDMFFTTKPRGLGTGLGLALVRRIVDRAGGSISLDTAVGKSTTFILTFPAVDDDFADDGAHPTTGVVSIADGRAASMATNLLDMAGVVVRRDDDPGDADIWMVEPNAARLAAAEAWRSRCPAGRLILFGEAPRSAAAWNKLQPVIITERDDFDSIRTAIKQATKP